MMTRAPAGPLSVVEPWDLVSEGYAAEVGWIMRPISLEALRRVAEAEPRALSKDAAVLDVAAGPGTLTIEASHRVREVHAIDFSEAMLSELSREVQRLGIRNVHAVQGDGMALPYPDERFDAAFSMFGLMFFPDRARGFSELFRVLRRGGLALASSWAPLDQSPLMDLMFGALRAAEPAMPPPARNLLSLENPDLFEEELRAAGFADVSVTPHEHFVTVDSADVFWSSMTRSAAPCLLLRKKWGETEWAERSERSLAFLRERFSGGPLRLSTVAFLGFGRKQ